MSKPLSYDDALALYDKLVETQPEIPRKGKDSPYTSVNTWMFSMVSKDGRVGMRLPKAKREEFNTKYKTCDYINYGAKIREYSEIPPDLLAKTDELAPWFEISYQYTLSLKPKKKK